MFSTYANRSMNDLLFNLILVFIILFSLSFILINESKKAQDRANVQSESNILITMDWDANVDMDLWLLMPDQKKVGYPCREVPPAHLDIDVTCWRSYRNPDGEDVLLKHNQEIIAIKGIEPGTYVVNTFEFSSIIKEPLDVTVSVFDVKNKKVIYTGTKTIKFGREEATFVKFDVEAHSESRHMYYSVTNVDTETQTKFVLQQPQDMGNNQQYDPRAYDYGNVDINRED